MKADEIKQLRKRLGLSQAKFGRVLGVHAMTVSRWERGKVEPDGATAQLLDVLDKRSLEMSRPANLGGKQLKMVVAGVAAAGLAALLAVLFHGKGKA